VSEPLPQQHERIICDASVRIDTDAYQACTLERCRLLYGGQAPVDIRNCHFIDCIWELDGAANNTLHFLRALYAHGRGGERLVEKWIHFIRTGAR
jgi:hypothetical protein